MPKPEPNSSILQQDQLELNETFNISTSWKKKSILIFVFLCKKVKQKNFATFIDLYKIILNNCHVFKSRKKYLHDIWDLKRSILDV